MVDLVLKVRQLAPSGISLAFSKKPVQLKPSQAVSIPRVSWFRGALRRYKWKRSP